jgi:hypothetical protein
MPLRPGGVGEYFFCEQVSVIETSTCAHCQIITDIPHRRKMMDYVDICRSCMALICLQCAGKPCLPAMKRIEMAEEKAYRAQQYRKWLGI